MTTQKTTAELIAWQNSEADKTLKMIQGGGLLITGEIEKHLRNSASFNKQTADRLAELEAALITARVDAFREAASIVRNFDYSKLKTQYCSDATLNGAANKLMAAARKSKQDLQHKGEANNA